MCLSCHLKRFCGPQSKKDIKEIFNSKFINPNEIYLNKPNNSKVSLNKEQIEEIIENAVAVLVTGVDFNLDIWSIQWENDYKVKTIN